MESIPDKAMDFWRKMPEYAKKGVVETSWCSKCMKGVTIENYTLSFHKPNLLLEGFCSECGKEIIRLVEGA